MAREKITKRIKSYAFNTGFRYKKVNITEALRSWGSCGYNGSLNFSCRLIMASLPGVDYVIIYELTHLEENNHTRDFRTRLRF
ncbi:MAG: M48 family metallopeptidase [Candidatus Omnitrophica bacterium]|nr:M48 family metallopeptidase [Candidatus Omnitrophota bacterium]